ncbi:hypothetical protein DFJ77DRAFT_428304 [Powellomyces hirtus]|nr:hypothetical protein DFJ77DRAFT_428304 [Powellomyces hirtus]
MTQDHSDETSNANPTGEDRHPADEEKSPETGDESAEAQEEHGSADVIPNSHSVSPTNNAELDETGDSQVESLSKAQSTTVFPSEPPLPKAPLDFTTDIELQSEYLQRKEEIKAAQVAYTQRHHELRDIMADYLQLLLHRKPRDVYSFTSQYFTI